VDNATLTVYDASGNVVSKVRVSDKALGIQARRQVAEWNLKDSKGRLVPECVYLVRGVVKASGGKRERWSVVLGVR
jgi:flagellar hook assembly protein FlgD